MQIPNLVQNLSRFLTNNSPAVLTAVGVAGVISTAVLTGKASYRAAQILGEESPFLKKTEIVRMVWTLYIPPISVAAITVTSIILANKIGAQRAAAVATALTVSQDAFKEYRDKVVEKVGEKKERELRDELAEERATRAGIPEVSTIIVPGSMKQRCYDQYSKRWFENTVDGLNRAANKVNYNMVHHEACSLNEFYSEIGLDPVPYGEQVGWDAMDKLDLVITSFLPADNIPAVSLDFYQHPRPNYNSLH